jgi:hypothetical protein
MNEPILKEPPKAWVEGEDSRITLRLGLHPREPMLYIQCMSTAEARQAALHINSMCEHAARIGAKQAGINDGPFSETIAVGGRSIRYAAPTVDGVQELKWRHNKQIAVDGVPLAEFGKLGIAGLVAAGPVDVTQLGSSVSETYDLRPFEMFSAPQMQATRQAIKEKSAGILAKFVAESCSGLYDSSGHETAGVFAVTGVEGAVAKQAVEESKPARKGKWEFLGAP